MVEVEVAVAAVAAADKTCIGGFEKEAEKPDPGSYSVIRKLGRKRVVSSDKNSAKKKCDEPSLSRLEALPEELLIRVLCGVDHADLGQLVRVSRTIREAALVAKRLHFSYSTPTKASPAFRNSIDLDDDQSLALADDNGDDIIELEPPKMKLRRNFRPRRFDPIKMAALAVTLFTDQQRDD